MVKLLKITSLSFFSFWALAVAENNEENQGVRRRRLVYHVNHDVEERAGTANIDNTVDAFKAPGEELDKWNRMLHGSDMSMEMSMPGSEDYSYEEYGDDHKKKHSESRPAVKLMRYYSGGSGGSKHSKASKASKASKGSKVSSKGHSGGSAPSKHSKVSSKGHSGGSAPSKHSKVSSKGHSGGSAPSKHSKVSSKGHSGGSAPSKHSKMSSKGHSGGGSMPSKHHSGGSAPSKHSKVSSKGHSGGHS